MGLRVWLLTLFAFAAVTAMSLWWHTVEEPATIRARLNAVAPGLALARWAAIGVVVAGWPVWVEWLGRRLPVQERTRLKTYRWRIAGWLVVLEIVLGQQLLARLLEVLQ